MPRRIIRRYLPDHRKVREHPQLQRFGVRLHDGNLWHLNRRSVSGGVAAGLFWAFVPIPFQMLPAAACAIWLRVNLPIAAALVWITNPLTLPPVWYASYRLGAWMLQLRPAEPHLDLSLSTLVAGMSGLWKPLLLGGVTIGAVLALAGFVAVRLTWRLYVVQQRRRRRLLRPLA